MSTTRAKDNLAELDQLLGRTAQPAVFLAAEVDGDESPQLQHLQLLDPLADEFRDAATAAVRSLVDESIENGVREFDPANPSGRGEIEFLEGKELPAFDLIVNSCASVGRMPIFQNEDWFVSGLRFMVTRLRFRGNKDVLVVKSYGRRKVLSRTASIKAVFSKGHFSKLGNEVMIFDPGADCIISGDMIFVTNANAFQKLFRYFEYLKRNAAQVLATIERTLPITNFKEFETACMGHFQMLAKVRSIGRKPYLDKLNIAAVKKVLSEFPELSLRITTTNGREAIEYSAEDKWAILRILDDDYLESIMTGCRYATDSKTEFGPA